MKPQPKESKPKSSNSQTSYEEWLKVHFPHIAKYPLSPRHIRLWDWFESLVLGLKIVAHVEIWPRGGAKSSTAELGVAFIGSKAEPPRNYVLYVSETQEQADKHVAAISSLLQSVGVGRSLSVYGHSKGWKRNQLRTDTGFNVESLGLDTAARGIKLDEFRPDLIIFDDIDNREDSPKATAKKIRSIKDTILPSGSIDCACLFIQNLVIEDGVLARLVGGTADFLLDAEIAPIDPAIYDLEYELVDRGDGRKVPKITGGSASWVGQSIDTCQSQMMDWGIDSFLRESQHEVKGSEGVFFKDSLFAIIDELPELDYIAVGNDTAATENGGDWTVGAAVGRAKNGTKGVIDLVRGQWGTENVESKLLEFFTQIYHRFKNDVRIVIVLPQDPGSAGKLWANTFAKKVRAIGLKVSIYTVTKNKAITAKGWQSVVNSGNAWLMRAPWNKEFKTEHQRFREDMAHDHDDIIDACSAAINRLEKPGWGDAL